MLVCLGLVVDQIGNICIAAPAQAAEAGDWSLILYKVGVAESVHLSSPTGLSVHNVAAMASETL